MLCILHTVSLPLMMSQILSISVQIPFHWGVFADLLASPSDLNSVNCTYNPCGNEPGLASLKTVISLPTPRSKACVSCFFEHLIKTHCPLPHSSPKLLFTHLRIWPSLQPGSDLSMSFSLAHLQAIGLAIFQLWMSFLHINTCKSNPIFQQPFTVVVINPSFFMKKQRIGERELRAQVTYPESDRARV